MVANYQGGISCVDFCICMANNCLIFTVGYVIILVLFKCMISGYLVYMAIWHSRYDVWLSVLYIYSVDIWIAYIHCLVFHYLNIFIYPVLECLVIQCTRLCGIHLWCVIVRAVSPVLVAGLARHMTVLYSLSGMWSHYFYWSHVGYLVIRCTRLCDIHVMVCNSQSGIMVLF